MRTLIENVVFLVAYVVLGIVGYNKLIDILPVMNILFQGDSITDAGRSRVIDSNLGNGYVGVISHKFKCDGINHGIKNRGIGGNRIIDIYARWIEDTLSLDYCLYGSVCGTKLFFINKLITPGKSTASVSADFDFITKTIFQMCCGNFV